MSLLKYAYAISESGTSEQTEGAAGSSEHSVLPAERDSETQFAIVLF